MRYFANARQKSETRLSLVKFIHNAYFKNAAVSKVLNNKKQWQ